MKDIYSHKSGANVTTEPEDRMKEHDKTVSRTLRRPMEISMQPLPGGMVPANPFASLQQSRFAHAHPEKFGGKKGLAEWDKETDYKSLPKKVKKH